MLLVVPTPIGNLGDLSSRALETLRNCDWVAAEDTRHTGLLLHRLGIKKKLISFHEHNEAARTAELISKIRGGEKVALVSDAGTPCISDPGARLVRECRREGLPVSVLPGPCAAITALVASGFDCSAFYFGGFLPPRSGGRQRELSAAAQRSVASIFYESPHRILKTLEDLVKLAPARKIAIARELTKIHEEVVVGYPGELLTRFQARAPRGEFCLVISGEEASAKTLEAARISACGDESCGS